MALTKVASVGYIDGANALVARYLATVYITKRNKKRLIKDNDGSSAVVEKVNKVRRLLYVYPGKRMSQIDVFWVPNGSTHIRLLYNDTHCRLTEVLYAPWFVLPGVRSHLRSVEAGAFLCDIDIEDKFYNFMLSSSL